MRLERQGVCVLRPDLRPKARTYWLKTAFEHARRGTLRDWKEGLKGPCKLSSYLTFAISLPFTAPLLQLLNIHEGCGFHFHGWPDAAEGQKARSSSGKTTATRAMTSVLD